MSRSILFRIRYRSFSNIDSEFPFNDHPWNKIVRSLRHEKEAFGRIFTGVKNLINLDYQPKKVDFKPLSYIHDDYDFPFETDILIIGGGLMGLSTAFWFRYFIQKDMKITILDQDINNNLSTSTLSMGGFRQSYSLPENILMSRFTSHFLKNTSDYLRLPINDHIINDFDIDLHSQGHLVLASDEGAEQLKMNYQIQRDYNCKSKILTTQQFENKYPWINSHGIKLAALGPSSEEGWYNPCKLMDHLKHYCAFYHTHFVQGRLLGFTEMNMARLYDAKRQNFFDATIPSKAIINADYHGDGVMRRKLIQFSHCVIAGGPNSGQIARMIGLGSDMNMREISLPIEPRKRYVYIVNCPEAPFFDFPFLVDYTGLTVRPADAKGNYMVMLEPTQEQEPDSTEDTLVDMDYFENVVWPALAYRIPCFRDLKLVNAWAVPIDYNFVDQNAIIGPHTFLDRVHFLTGFSGQGTCFAPAAARACMEHILYGKSVSIDLQNLTFKRFTNNLSMREKAIA